MDTTDHTPTGSVAEERSDSGRRSRIRNVDNAVVARHQRGVGPMRPWFAKTIRKLDQCADPSHQMPLLKYATTLTIIDKVDHITQAHQLNACITKAILRIFCGFIPLADRQPV